jgi:hypothetical protein
LPSTSYTSPPGHIALNGIYPSPSPSQLTLTHGPEPDAAPRDEGREGDSSTEGGTQVRRGRYRNLDNFKP